MPVAVSLACMWRMAACLWGGYFSAGWVIMVILIPFLCTAGMIAVIQFTLEEVKSGLDMMISFSALAISRSRTVAYVSVSKIVFVTET